jgi:nicotinic acid mononucleotide adenylyltransferase
MRHLSLMPPAYLQVLQHIRKNIHSEIARMIDIHPSDAKDNLLISIIEEFNCLLEMLSTHLKDGVICPHMKLAVSDMDLPRAFYNRAVRIGVYPISANPLHWGHIAVGLSAMAAYKLDKVIFVPAGADPRKDLLPVDWRHGTCREILQKFSPLFEYSDIARNNNNDGESNVFKILALNPFQKMDAFYIAGTDHYYRFSPVKKGKDTIEKLEENMAQKYFYYNEMMHSLSVIFAQRQGGACLPVKTSLNTCFIPLLKFQASSTMVREALISKQNKASLALLPYTIYEKIHSYGAHFFARSLCSPVLNQ